MILTATFANPSIGQILKEAEAPGKITNEFWSITLEDESLGSLGAFVIEGWLSKIPNS